MRYTLALAALDLANQGQLVTDRLTLVIRRLARSSPSICRDWRRYSSTGGVVPWRTRGIDLALSHTSDILAASDRIFCDGDDKSSMILWRKSRKTRPSPEVIHAKGSVPLEVVGVKI